MQHVVLIDPNGPSLQTVSDAESRVQIGSVNGGSETVSGGVSNLDGVVFVFEFRDGTDGAEDFLLDDLHVFAHIGEDGGLDEVTKVAVTLTACFDLGACLFAGVDVSRVVLAHIPYIDNTRDILHDAIVLKL